MCILVQNCLNIHAGCGENAIICEVYIENLSGLLLCTGHIYNREDHHYHCLYSVTTTGIILFYKIIHMHAMEIVKGPNFYGFCG